MTDSQLKAILTMLALPMIDGTRSKMMPEVKSQIDDSCAYEYIEILSDEERILEAEKLAEKVMGGGWNKHD